MVLYDGMSVVSSIDGGQPKKKRRCDVGSSKDSEGDLGVAVISPAGMDKEERTQPSLRQLK